jgi:TRAP-type mannitol/chloroaromatic compound transport system permease large subunit
VSIFRKLWEKLKNFIKWLLKTLGDKTNIIIFIIVFAAVSCEVWVPYLIAIITGIEWWWVVGSACWAFWLAPFTPFIPLCIVLTAVVRKIYDKIKKRKGEG